MRGAVPSPAERGAVPVPARAVRPLTIRLAEARQHAALFDGAEAILGDRCLPLRSSIIIFWRCSCTSNRSRNFSFCAWYSAAATRR